MPIQDVSAEVSARPAVHSHRAWAVTMVMAGLLLAGAAFRFVGLNWDQYQHVHPDERFVVWVAETIRWPADPRTFLDPSTSPLNPFRWPEGSADLSGQPRNYAYGHFPLYLLVAVAHGGQTVSQWLAGLGLDLPSSFLHLSEYDNLALAGRTISALCDLGTIVLVFLLARRAYGDAGQRVERVAGDPEYGRSLGRAHVENAGVHPHPGPLPFRERGLRIAEVIPSPSERETLAPHCYAARCTPAPHLRLGAGAGGAGGVRVRVRRMDRSTRRAPQFRRAIGIALCPQEASGSGRSAPGTPTATHLRLHPRAAPQRICAGVQVRAYATSIPGLGANIWHSWRSESGGAGAPLAQGVARAISYYGSAAWSQRGVIVGPMAAAAYALAVLPAQLSHYATVDLVLTFAVTAAVLLAVRGAQTGRFWTWPAAGALAGLAIGSKFSAAVIFAPLMVAAVFTLPGRDAPIGPRRTLIGRLTAIFLAAALVFVITNPFAVLDGQAFLRNLAAQNAMVRGVMDAPYTRQYAGTAPYWYYVQQLSQWGLGWPLGLAAWAGFVWVAIRAGMRRARPAEVIMLAWALPYFGITGSFYAKFMRYMAPLLPFLLIFAAGALLAAGRWLHARWGRRGALAAAGAIGLIFLFTAGWALVFSGVYRQEHPWIQASNWIYRNVPAGSKLLAEQWDDALPLAMDEIPTRPPKRQYSVVELPLYEPDNSAKLDRLVAELSSADYIVLSSSRLSRPIQNLPGRYPMSSQYYRLLFNGGLGYTQVADFSAYPRLGSWVVADENADESLTVYDHPHSHIFANTGRLSQSLLRARLGRYLPLRTGLSAPDDIVQTGKAPGHASLIQSALPAGGAAPPATGMAGADAQSVAPDDTPPVAGLRWNRFASEWPPAGIVIWWLAISLFGWLAFPLIFPLLGGLRDRGYGLARLVGWLLVGWVHWLGVSLGLWQNRLGPLAVLLVLLLLAGLAAAFRQRSALAAFWSRQRRLILIEEGLFALVFLAFTGIRLLDPDLWQPWNGGEKFMEFAFLNAILRSAHFPPYDPYFAHGTINYYYYGLYLVSLPIKLTGIFSEVAFNLAIPGLFALATLAAFSVGASLAPRSRAAVRTGLLAVGLALLMANLSGFEQLQNRLADLGRAAGSTGWSGFLAVRGLIALLRGASWQGYDYWAVSRVIPFTINEFPFWSFLFADLHPHLIAMPVGFAVAGLALNWVLPARRPGDREEADAAAVVDTAEATGQGNAAHAAVAPSLAAEEPLLPEVGSIRADADQLPEVDGPSTAGPGPAFAEESDATSPALAAAVVSEPAVTEVGEGTGGLLGRLLGPQVPWPVVAGRLALLVIMLGALGPTNTWDLPVYFLLVAGAFWLAAWRARRGLSALEAVLLASLTVALAVAAYLPFYQHYSAQVGGQSGSFLGRYLGFVQSSSALQPWLKVWAIFLFLAYSFALLEFWRRRGHESSQRDGAAAGENRLPDPAALSPDGQTAQAGPDASSVDSLAAERPSRARSGQVILFLALIGVALVFAMAGRPTVALTIVPMGLALALAFRRSFSPHLAFVSLLVALAMAILAGSELIYLRDFLEGGDWYRMNTVFKFAIPAWLLLGLASAVILPGTWTWLGRVGGWFGSVWQVAAVLLIAAGFAFLPFGTQARVDDRFPGARPAIGTPDGTAYMTVGRYSWPSDQHVIELSYDYQAIHWMLDHITGAPVVAEAPAGSYEVDGQSVGYDYYRAGGLRVASLTGFPTFVGQHQYEQRPAKQVGERTALGQEFFETTDLARTRELMHSLGVDYIYIGQLERLLFKPASLDKFARLAQTGELETVYYNSRVVIYRVVK